MATQGPNYPTDSSDNFGADGAAWSNTDSARISDDSRASASLTGFDRTDSLEVFNFGFSIPAGATIDGIVVTVEYSSDGPEGDLRIQMLKSGTLVGINQLIGFGVGVDTQISVGGPTVLHGTTWTPGDINHNNFGARVYFEEIFGNAGTVEIDSVAITVTYTEAAPPAGAKTLTLLGVG